MHNKSKDGVFWGWISIAGAGIAFFVQNGTAYYSFGVFLPWICKECNWTRGDVSIAWSICMMLGMLCAPVAGFLIAKYGVKKAIVIGNLLIALALLALAFQRTLWQFYTAYALVGIGAGLAGIIAVSTLASNWFVEKGPMAMSIVTGSGGIGGLVLVPIVAVLVSSIGWRQAYVVLFALMFVFGVLVPVVMVKNRPEDVGKSPAGIGSGPEQGISEERTPSSDFTLNAVLRTRVFWLLTAFGCTSLFVFMFFTAHQIAYLTGLGVNREIAALTLGLIPGAAVLGTLAVGFLSLKYSLRGLAILAALTIMISTILAFMTRSAPLAFVFSILFGTGFGAELVCIMSMLSAYFGRANYSKIFGVSGLFTILGALGAPMGGFLFDAQGTYLLPLIIVSGVAALGIICIIAAKPPAPASLKTKEFCNEGLR